MLYFIFGDQKKVFKKSAELVDLMLKKKPEAVSFKIDFENWSNDKFENLIGGKSLFEQKYIISMSHVLSDEIVGEYVLKKLSEISKSENIFIWSEVDPGKKDLEKIKKLSQKIQEYKSEVRQETFRGKRGFVVADFLGQRNAKGAWLAYLKIKNTIAPEEIHGILWWQLKCMILAKGSKNALETGLKPFVYSKSKKYAENFTSEELEKLSDDLVCIYHESRRGGAELSVRLEKFILQI